MILNTLRITLGAGLLLVALPLEAEMGTLEHSPTLASGARAVVEVPATSNITLAGQPDGMEVSYSNDSSPLNSPVLVPFAVIPGQVVHVTATGVVSQRDPEGDSADAYTREQFGLSEIRGPAYALVGVFLGPEAPRLDLLPPSAIFRSAGRDRVSLWPMLQQPFFIGRGTSASGASKGFVVPLGATRLLLGVLGTSVGSYTGSFSATAWTSDGESPAPLFPRVPGNANITLSGQPSGKEVSYSDDASPMSSPVEVPGGVAPGQVLQLSAPGGDGDVSQNSYTREQFGISEVTGPVFGLIGVFLGPTAPDPALKPPNLDFKSSAARNQSVVRPVLQQAFFVGSGTTSDGKPKSYVAPVGATRFFLGVLGYSLENAPRGYEVGMTATWMLASTAHLGGAGGSFYTTDVVLSNRGALQATYTLKFLGNNSDGRPGPEKSYSLAPGSSVVHADVLASAFGVGAGWGAIRISSSSFSLGISAQTSTPGAGGSFGQSVPAAGPGDFVSVGLPRTVDGIRETGSFRTNLILANASEVPVDVDVTLFAASGANLGSKRYPLPPLGMTQVSRVVRDLGVTADVPLGRIVVSTSSSGGFVATYASVIDNVTNDPRTLLAR